MLFDEIEKAHEDVWNILLQILEDGVVTDAQGHKVDFRNTAVIMTSNIGAKSITAAGTPLGFAPEEQKSADAQFAAVKAAVIAELRRTFRPEFLNRMDETIVFRRLSREDCAEIARAGCLRDRFPRRGARHHACATKSEPVSLAERGYDVSYGARPLRRLIRGEVEDALATCLLDGTLASGDTAVLAAENGTLCVHPAGESGGRRPRRRRCAEGVKKGTHQTEDPTDGRSSVGSSMLVYGLFAVRMMRGLFALEGMKPAWQTGSC